MSKDIVHIEWHLTPIGWVRGNWCINKPFESSVRPPADRIETWVKTETTDDRNFVQTKKEWSLRWVSSQYTEADRKALRAIIRKPAPNTDNPKDDFPLR
ncbi:MAG: hypothetical protein QM706_06990 [Nitrospira sp.]